MKPSSRAFRPEAPLAHREWIERAARALVFADADAADETGRDRFRQTVPGRYRLTGIEDGVGQGRVGADVPAGENTVDVRIEWNCRARASPGVATT